MLVNAVGMYRGGDAQMLQDLEALRRRCSQQEAQLSTQEQIILSLSARAGRTAADGPGSDAGSADNRMAATPPVALPGQGVTPSPVAVEEDEGTGQAEEADSEDEVAEDAG